MNDMLLKILKFLSFWFLINFAISIVITALKHSSTQPDSTLNQFLIVLIITNAIALPSEFAGNLVGREIIHKPLLRVLGITIFVSLVASLLSMVPASFLLYNLSNISQKVEPIYYITNIVIPGFFLTIAISSASVLIMYFLIRTKEIKEKSDPKLNESSAKIPVQFLTVKEDENHVIIPLKTILYISAGKDNSIIHTLDRDHKISRILKQVEQMLPFESFLRVHKSYIVNLEWVSHIQYLAGGRYIAFLKDEDETEVLIGKSFAGELKQRIGM
jgi:hypothetical protein